jgi:hypothetical protein
MKAIQYDFRNNFWVEKYKDGTVQEQECKSSIWMESHLILSHLLNTNYKEDKTMKIYKNTVEYTCTVCQGSAKQYCPSINIVF